MKTTLFTILSVLFVTQLWTPNSHGQTDNTSKPKIISHRGVSYWAPEESRPAYLLAAALASDYWEMDLHRTKDGVIVVTHDDTLERTTNVAKVFPGREKNELSTFTWAELQQLEVGEAFNKANPERARPSFIGLRLLSFEQLIEMTDEVNYRGGLYIETKSPEKYPGIEMQIVDLLKQKKWLSASGKSIRPVVFQSFSQKSILLFGKLAPNVDRTLLISAKKVWKWWGALQFANKHKVTIGSPEVMFKAALLREAVLNLNLPVHQWTVDSEESIQKAAALQLDAIFTNRTDLAVRAYRNGQATIDICNLLVNLNY